MLLLLSTRQSVRPNKKCEALRESRQRNTPFLTKIKVESGVDREEAVKEVTQDVMNGDVDIQAVTASIDSLLKVEEQQKKK